MKNTKRIIDEFSDVPSANKRWKLRNPLKAKQSDHRRRQDYRLNNPVGYILKRAKNRAKEKGLEFSISKEDIIIPDICPILGYSFNFKATKKDYDAAPSLDRIDSSKGYIKGNVHVISHRANTLKSNATIEELEKVIKFLKEIN